NLSRREPRIEVTHAVREIMETYACNMRHSGRTFLRYLPVTLLLLGIMVHAVQIEVLDEDPQRGSAFAMFATVDVGASRRVVATSPGASTLRLWVPEGLREHRGTRAEPPSDTTARQLAAELLSRRWDVEGDAASAGSGDMLEGVRVEVVGLHATGWS